MGATNTNILKLGFFKQAKYLVSSPSRAMMCAFLSTTGTTSLEQLPIALSTPMVFSHGSKMAWNVLEKSKIRVEGFNERVLPICEMSRFPLDPGNHLTKEEKESFASLETTFQITYDREMSKLEDKHDVGPNVKTAVTLIWFVSIALIVALIGLVVKGL